VDDQAQDGADREPHTAGDPPAGDRHRTLQGRGR